jgi:outer membrane protein TolC
MNMKTFFSTLVLFSLMTVLFAQEEGQEEGAMILSQAEQLALAHHPKILAAKSEMSIMQAEARTFLSAFQPHLSFSAFGLTGKNSTIVRSSLDSTMLFRDGTTLATSAMFAWRVYSSGEDVAARAYGHKRIEFAQNLYAIACNEVILKLRLAFSYALHRVDMLNAAKASLAAAEEIERITKERFAAGTLAEAFVFRALAMTAKARSELAMSSAAHDASLGELKEAIGIPFDQPLVAHAWDLPKDAPEDLSEAIEIALRSHPEIRSLESQAKAYQLAAEQARKSQNPSLDLIAMNDSMKNWFKPIGARNTFTEDSYKIGIVLSIPLADGGLRKAEADKHAEISHKLQNEANAARLRVQSEVSSAWFDWNVAPLVIEAADAEIKAAMEAYRIAKLRYQEGKAVHEEILMAFASLRDAMVSKAEASAHQRDAWAKLMYAIGKFDPTNYSNGRSQNDP